MDQENKCWLCNDQINNFVPMPPFNLLYSIGCDRCGNYFISRRLIDWKEQYKEQYKDELYILQGYYRSRELPWDFNYVKENCPEDILTTETIDKLIAQNRGNASLDNKISKTLKYFKDRYNYFDYPVEVNIPKDYPLIYGKNLEEFNNLLNQLVKSGYLKYHTANRYALTIQGMSYLKENIESTRIFLAMDFNNESKAMADAIKAKVYEETGYSIETVTPDHNDLIDDAIIAGIKSSKALICDLTYNNRGAYWEAGFAKGLGLEVIYICKEEAFTSVNLDEPMKNELIQVMKLPEKNKFTYFGKELSNFLKAESLGKLAHFDVNHYNTIYWSDFEDLHEKLIYRIKATLPISKDLKYSTREPSLV